MRSGVFFYNIREGWYDRMLALLTLHHPDSAQDYDVAKTFYHYYQEIYDSIYRM